MVVLCSRVRAWLRVGRASRLSLRVGHQSRGRSKRMHPGRECANKNGEPSLRAGEDVNDFEMLTPPPLRVSWNACALCASGVVCVVRVFGVLVI